MVEPEVNHLTSSNLLESNEKQLVVTKTYAVKWRKNEVDLVELAKRRWINKMSYRDIAASMKITRGQVDWGLRQFKIKHPSASNNDGTILKEIWLMIEQEKKK